MKKWWFKWWFIFCRPQLITWFIMVRHFSTFLILLRGIDQLIRLHLQIPPTLYRGADAASPTSSRCSKDIISVGPCWTSSILLWLLGKYRLIIPDRHFLRHMTQSPFWGLQNTRSPPHKNCFSCMKTLLVTAAKIVPSLNLVRLVNPQNKKSHDFDHQITMTVPWKKRSTKGNREPALGPPRPFSTWHDDKDKWPTN